MQEGNRGRIGGGLGRRAGGLCADPRPIIHFERKCYAFHLCQLIGVRSYFGGGWIGIYGLEKGRPSFGLCR